MEFNISKLSDSQSVFLEIKKYASESRMSNVKITELLTATSELITNIIKYAGDGIVKVDIVSKNGNKLIVVKAIDKGPGITDIDLALKIGYSSNGTFGIGLPGAKKLSDEFYIDSAKGKGTTVTLVKRA